MTAHFFFCRLLVLYGLLILFPGCSADRPTFELKYGQQLPESVWGDSGNIEFDLKYEFDYHGKHHIFAYPEKGSTQSRQGTIDEKNGNHIVQTYSQWVEVSADEWRTVYLMKNALGERFLVKIPPYEADGRYRDIQTGEVISEFASVETVEISAQLCKPDKQSAEYRRARELERKYPMPAHMID